MKSSLTRVRFAVVGVFAICGALTAGSVAFAVADLSGWVGVDNLSPANNYVVANPPTSVGGTFAERRLNAASLSDQSLTGGPFVYGSSLTMSGTITVPTTVDPVWFLGWYNSANLNERIGIGMANPVPAGNGTRWQTQSGNTSSTSVVSQDFVPNANATTQRMLSTFAPGTYNFTFAYDGAGHMDYTFGSVTNTRNYANPISDLDGISLDRFGILQKSTVDDNANTFALTLSNVNYTGDTQFAVSSDSADFNDDDIVDGTDLLIFQRGLGLTGQTNHANGDANNSGTVDGDDLVIFRNQFGTDPPSGVAGLSIPEPGSSTLLLLAAIGGGVGRFRARRV